MKMSYDSHDKIINRVLQHLEDFLTVNRTDWFVIVAQGSMNYGIMGDESDVDTKILTVPSLAEVVKNSKPQNKVHFVGDTDEHCEAKDVREYCKLFRKSNINYVEILFSKFYVVNELYEDLWNKLRENRELLARMNPYLAVNCMKGMASEKLRVLDHPYPSRAHTIEQYGFDPKQLSHIMRIRDFTRSYIQGKSYAECLYPTSEATRSYWLDCKRNRFNLSKEEAFKRSQIAVSQITDWVDSYKETVCNQNDPDADKLLDDVLYEIIKRSWSSELLERG